MADKPPIEVTPTLRRRFRLMDTITRVAKITQASAELVANVLSNAERVVDDVLRDSQAVAAEAAGLGASAIEGAQQLRKIGIITPRVTRVVRQVMWVVATYQLQKKRHELLGTEPTDEATDRLHRANAKRLYTLCVEERGALIKLGQLLSARVDILPKPYIDQLALLQDQVPPVATSAIRERIEEDLQEPVDELFAWFDDEPLAAASLGQVHRARLLDGAEVVVKVRVPGIVPLVESDLAAFRLIAQGLKDVIKNIDLVTVAEELTRSIREELNYTAEAASARAFGEQFEGDSALVVPAVHKDYSTGRVLTLEWLDGKRLIPFLDECEAYGDDGAEDRDWIFEKMVVAYAQQILEHGLFHSDPHPGNFLVLPGPRLAFLDFGSVMRFSPQQRRAYAELATTIVMNDAARMGELFEVMGFATSEGEREGLEEFARVFLAAFRDDLAGSLGDLDPTEQLEKAMTFVRNNPIVQIPQDFVLLGRVFATVSGYVLRYKPDLSLYTMVLPYLAKAVQPAPE